MSNTTEQDRRVNLERAQRDLEDINELLKFDPFIRYFMRRLKQKYAELDKKFRHDKMPAEDREAIRQTLEYMESVFAFVGSDKELTERQINDLMAGVPLPTKEGEQAPRQPTSPARPGYNANS